MKKLLLIMAALVLCLSVVGCSKKDGPEPTKTPEVNSEVSQGVTDTTILVGNTAATSGAFAFVGTPFNDALIAVFKEVNDNGGIDGRTIEFVTYDDGFNAATGKTLTEKLVEEDEIFSLVGHFGTPTVGATVDYIQEIGIPMVYAATGINDLYFKESLGNPVMAVQPIYKTDGRIMTARAFNEAIYGVDASEKLTADAKVGVLYTNDEAGNGIFEGIKEEAEVLGKTDSLVIEAVGEGTYATGVQKLQEAGVSAIILAVNQEPFKQSLVALNDAGLNVPVFTSYNNADVTAVDESKFNPERPLYVNAWVDVFSEKGQEEAGLFIGTINNSALSDELKTSYATNSFAIAGYVAGKVFVEGIERVAANGDVLNHENFIKAMEQEPINVPMGGTVDYSDGKRWGVDSMSLLQYTILEDGTEVFAKVREIETLEEIEAK